MYKHRRIEPKVLNYSLYLNLNSVCLAKTEESGNSAFYILGGSVAPLQVQGRLILETGNIME